MEIAEGIKSLSLQSIFGFDIMVIVSDCLLVR
jgi:hypothetical protein